MSAMLQISVCCVRHEFEFDMWRHEFANVSKFANFSYSCGSRFTSRNWYKCTLSWNNAYVFAQPHDASLARQLNTKQHWLQTTERNIAWNIWLVSWRDHLMDTTCYVWFKVFSPKVWFVCILTIKKPSVRLKTTSSISPLAKTIQNINCYLLEHPSQTTITLFIYTEKVIHDTVYPP